MPHTAHCVPHTCFFHAFFVFNSMYEPEVPSIHPSIQQHRKREVDCLPYFRVTIRHHPTMEPSRDRVPAKSPPAPVKDEYGVDDNEII